MKTLIVSLLIFFVGCIGTQTISSTSGLSVEFLNSIPKNSSEIIVTKENISAEGLYEEIITAVISRGHRIINDDKERYYLLTEGKDVGQSTLHRITVLVTEGNNSSHAIIRTEWMAGGSATTMATAISGIQATSNWERAVWVQGRSGLAFAESAAIAKEIENATISYK